MVGVAFHGLMLRTPANIWKSILRVLYINIQKTYFSYILTPVDYQLFNSVKGMFGLKGLFYSVNAHVV